MLIIIYFFLHWHCSSAQSEEAPLLCTTTEFRDFPSNFVPFYCPLTTNESSITYADMQAKGWKFAPVLNFHPLETSFPASVDSWLQNAHIFDSTNADLGPATKTNIFNHWQRTDVTFSVLQDPLNTGKERIPRPSISGDPFVDGKSTSPVYMRLNQKANSWVYSFWFFYAWNGCSNQAVLYEYIKTERYLEYYACNMGVHEGDWEAVRK